MHCIFQFSSVTAIATAALLTIGSSLPASAQQQPYVEKPYNPPVGSRWTVHSESKAVEHRGAGEERNQQTSIRSELTIDAKLADGYRISYVSREIKVTGNSPVARV